MNRRFFLRGTAALATPLAIAPRLAGQAGAARVDEARSESSSAHPQSDSCSDGDGAPRLGAGDFGAGDAGGRSAGRDDSADAGGHRPAQRGRASRSGDCRRSHGLRDGRTAYAQAADWTGDKQLREAVDGLMAWIRVKAPRGADGTLYHVFNAPEVWSDGFNGAPPFLASMGFHDEALAQIEGFKKTARGTRKRSCWRTSGTTANRS